MRKWLVGLWILILPAFALWHSYGGGRQYRKSDETSALVRRAESAASRGDWDAAITAYSQAIEAIPQERIDDIRRMKLARSIARLRGETFGQGCEELRALVSDWEREPNRDPQALRSARTALAYGQYHASWLMRLEGRPKEQWEPEVEAARQWFRVSAEEAIARGDVAAAARIRQDLELTVRMARLDLPDLQARNLPEELQNSSSDDGKPESDREGKKGNRKAEKAEKGNPKEKGFGEGKSEDEGLGKGRKQPKDARSASAGPPPDKGGH